MGLVQNIDTRELIFKHGQSLLVTDLESWMRNMNRIWQSWMNFKRGHKVRRVRQCFRFYSQAFVVIGVTHNILCTGGEPRL